MNPQYQGAQGQVPMEQTYYQPSYDAGKEVATGYSSPDQQQVTSGYGYNNTGNSVSPQTAGYAHDPPPIAPTSSGAKRSTCLALLVATIILLASVIGLGAGLGVSQRNLHKTQADLARATASPSAATTVTVTATPASTGSRTSSSASASATADASNIICPKNNDTVYTAATDSKQFRELCGIDYSDGEAESVGSVTTTNSDFSKVQKRAALSSGRA
ncbi:hypothetical protein VPNG_06283 [Cytospora leucostoma]|uniref:Uncharacterized protein n=1 Tax=Cytospora leucostoma TaxID=1230097 RepID=A0A423X2A9_9PEZI|nr:hypothetical protein VPNG_06283 [Cytospora leucostoma]